MLGKRSLIPCWIAAFGTIATGSIGSASERLELAGGFQPDPAVLAYEATGEAAASVLVSGCPGYIGAEPALSVTVADATARLNVFLVGEEAAGVLVAGPDGIHHCDTADQFGIAHIRFERVISGDYLIWPLVAAAGADLSGTLLVSEIELGPRDVANHTGLRIDPALLPPLLSEHPLEPSAEPAVGYLSLQEGGLQKQTVILSGGVSAADAGPGCGGDINQLRPDATLRLTAPEPVLAFSATALVDTTLVVVAPDGTVLCNDDAVNYDPAIVVSNAAAGDYAIWIGVFGAGAGEEAVLSIGREPPRGVGSAVTAPTLDPAAAPAFGRHQLPQEGLLELALTLSGGVPAGSAVPGCVGEIDPSRPDAIVNLASPEPELWFHAAGENADATLVVVRPDGEVLCNDDHDNYDPVVGVVDAAAGDYAVWVGVYAGGGGAAAVLEVGREIPVADSSAGPGVGITGNPFAGHTIDSARQAFEILVAEFHLSEVMTYQRIEETGPEALTLHGVVVRDPSGAEAPLEIGRIRISDLDLAGLAANGVPERFSLAVEDVSYTSLAVGAYSHDLLLPTLDEPPPLSISASLLPVDGDMTRRAVRLHLGLEGQIDLSLGAEVLWPDGAGAMGPQALDAIKGTSVEIELRDMGFLGTMLRELAAESGQSIEQLADASLDDLSALFSPLTPGSPRAQLVEMLRASFTDLDRSGNMRLSIRAAEPVDMPTLLEALAADEIDPSLLEVEIDYRPDP